MNKLTAKQRALEQQLETAASPGERYRIFQALARQATSPEEFHPDA